MEFNILNGDRLSYFDGEGEDTIDDVFSFGDPIKDKNWEEEEEFFAYFRGIFTSLTISLFEDGQVYISDRSDLEDWACKVAIKALVKAGYCVETNQKVIQKETPEYICLVPTDKLIRAGFVHPTPIEKSKMEYRGVQFVELALPNLYRDLIYRKNNLDLPDQSFLLKEYEEIQFAHRLVKIYTLGLIEKKSYSLAEKQVRNKWRAFHKLNPKKFPKLKFAFDLLDMTWDQLARSIISANTPIVHHFFGKAPITIYSDSYLIFTRVMNLCRKKEIPAMPTREGFMVPDFCAEEIIAGIEKICNRFFGNDCRGVVEKINWALLSPTN